ncbi:MAG: hypothetical protein ACRC7N_03150 [Clostridium sp.]
MFFRTKTTDVWEQKVTLERFNPVRRIVNGEDVSVVLRNIDTNEEMVVRLNDFRDGYKLSKVGDIKGKVIFL